jgi:hypothetical protein
MRQEHEVAKTHRRERPDAIRTADLHVAGYAGLGLNGCTRGEYISVSCLREMRFGVQQLLSASNRCNEKAKRQLRAQDKNRPDNRLEMALEICGIWNGRRQSGLARPSSDGRIPSAWRGDEIGKHSGLKIRRLTACRFKSGPRYQRPNHLIKTLGVKRKFAGTRCVVFRQFLVRTAFHCVSVQPRSWRDCAASRTSIQCHSRL